MLIRQGAGQEIAKSNASHLELVDDALLAFAKDTRGTLVSPTTASRKEIHTGKAAKVDHLITWNVEAEGEG